MTVWLTESNVVALARAGQEAHAPRELILNNALAWGFNRIPRENRNYWYDFRGCFEAKKQKT